MKRGSAIAKPPKKRKGSELIVDNDFVSVPQPLRPKSATRTSTVNLSDWLESPILAKDGPIHYYPGVIKSVPSSTSVEIQLDKHNEPQTFSDVLSKNDEIISNHSAPAIMIKQGLVVCVKSKPADHYFSVGTVKELKQGPPMQCLIQVNDTYQELWVSRAAIRLMQPPWYDDLEDTGGQEVSGIK